MKKLGAKILNILSENFLFLIIFILATFLRFYRLPEMAYFDFDQEYAANFAWSVWREFPIQMIGQGLSIQGLFMGPFYFYYLVPFFALFNLHPLGGAVGSVVLGLVIVLAYYYYGNKFFGKPAGLIAAFLRGILFSKLEADWSMVSAYSSELLVLITWYCFYQYWQGKVRYLPLLGLVFGLYTSFHPILFPFYLVFLVLLLLKRIWPNFKTLLLSLGAFILPVTPLILFEYFHKFLELRLMVDLFTARKSGLVTSINWVEYIKIILAGPQQTLGFNIYPSGLVSMATLLFLVIFTLKRVGDWKESFHLLLLSMTILIFVLYYYFLPTHVISYYFLAPISLLLFYLSGILGYLITKSKMRVVVVVFLIYVALLNIRVLHQNKWSYPSLVTLAHKERIVKAIIERQPRNKEFFVSYISSPGWNFGFGYLFKLYGRPPHDKVVEGATYTIVTPKSLSPESINISSGNIGLILP